MDVDINGITVIFPYKPYDIQLEYMRSVISALQKKENALLESPTGTGKTLSLLCSTLAWLDHRKYQDLELNASDVPNDKDYSIINNNNSAHDNNNHQEGQLTKKPGKGGGKGWKNESPIRIIYSSRTHSQLNQACAELKRSYYKFCQTVTIGSRDQLCINPEVTRLETISAKNQSCRMKVKSNTCKFHNNYEQKMSDLSFSGSAVYDIEDLVKFGNEHKACPYYMAKAKSDFNTSLVFMPYNYVLDPSIRRTLKLNLENSVIIFDEGHNIERVCEDSMSKELKSEWLAVFINTFDTALKSLKLLEEGKYDGSNEKELSELNIHDIAKIKMVMCDLEGELDRMIRKDANNTKLYHQTDEIFKIFDRVQLDYDKCGLIVSVCEKLITFVMSSISAYMTNAIITALNSVCSFIEVIMPFAQVKGADLNNYKTDFVKNYRLYSEIETENSNFGNKTWGKKKTQNTWTLYLWCMSPSVAIKSLQSLGVYNLLITSGTLAPLESFECEMGIPFPIKLQNSHVISKNQLSIQLIFKDPNGYELSGSYANRNDIKYYSGLGFTILELARTIPKGMFIFFSSYSLINKCIEMWKNRQGVNLWASISNLKRVYIEPRSKNEFTESMNSFKETVDATPEGAIFMAVSRGKLSEGIDLGDDYCRAVIIVGLPYPARFDPKVVLKQKYLDESNSKLNGIKWYMLQMKRALNQSIGRVVRHKDDYGAIIICDSRFKQLSDGLSKWIQAFLTGNMHARINADFKTKLQDIQNFYQQLDGSSIQRTERIASAPASTSTGTKHTNSAMKPAAAAAYSSNDTLIESTFDSMKSSYLTHKSNDNSGAMVRLSETSGDSDSIFNSFSYLSGAAKKRNFESSIQPVAENLSNGSKRRSTPFASGLDYFKDHMLDDSDLESIIQEAENKPISSNDKMINASKYLSRSSNLQSSGRSSLHTKPSIPVPDLDAGEEIFAGKSTSTPGCSVNANAATTTTSPNASNRTSNKPGTPNAQIEAVDFTSEEIVNLTNSFCKTGQDYNTFQLVMEEIKNSNIKSRQFIETLRIYSKKRNSTYLALRMNFILDGVIGDKRNVILKDFSLIIPERERRQFLGTCKLKN